MVTSLLPSVNALRINEIMYDPDYNENYNEWIEIYNEGEAINLESYTLCGRSLVPGFVDTSGTIEGDRGLLLEAGAYALVTDGGSGSEVLTNYDIDDKTLVVHVDAASMCGGLSNEGETIILGEEEFSYGGDAEPGFSVEWGENGFVSGSTPDGTPGRGNTPRATFEESKKDRVSVEENSGPIRLSSSPEIDNVLEETYITPEGKVRQTIVYVFAGFCVLVMLLIILKRM